MPPVSPRELLRLRQPRLRRSRDARSPRSRIEHRFTNDLTLRNTLRIANYKRQVEATIATLRATDIERRAASRRPRRCQLLRRDAQPRRRPHARQRRRRVHQPDRADLEVRRVGHAATRCSPASSSRASGSTAGTTRSMPTRTWPGSQAPTSITSLLSPDPYTLLSYTKTPNVRARRRGGHRRALCAGPDGHRSRRGRPCSACAGRTTTPRRARRTYLTGAPPPDRSSAPTRCQRPRRPDLAAERAPVVLRIAAGNSYNPSGELGVYGGTGTNLNAINENLDPEENRNYEIGAQWDFAYGLQLRAALFRTEKINARMADPVLGATVLAGKRRVDGIELAADGTHHAQLGRLQRPRLHGRRDRHGPGELRATCRSAWPMSRATSGPCIACGGGWEVGGGVRDSSGFWLNDANTGKVPELHGVVDATVAYVQEKYEMRLNVNNISRQDLLHRRLPEQPRTACSRARRAAPRSRCATRFI